MLQTLFCLSCTIRKVQSIRHTQTINTSHLETVLRVMFSLAICPWYLHTTLSPRPLPRPPPTCPRPGSRWRCPPPPCGSWTAATAPPHPSTDHPQYPHSHPSEFPEPQPVIYFVRLEVGISRFWIEQCTMHTMWLSELNWVLQYIEENYSFIKNNIHLSGKVKVSNLFSGIMGFFSAHTVCICNLCLKPFQALQRPMKIPPF